MAVKLTSAQERCWEAALKINRQARESPDSPYAGKWVGFADGELAVVADTMDGMLDRLPEIEPDPDRCMGIEASADYDTVYEVWDA